MAASQPRPKNFYTQSARGASIPDIAMPADGDTTPIAAAIDPWASHSQPTQEEHAAAPVPDVLPSDVEEAMADHEHEHEDDEQEVSESSYDSSSASKAQSSSKKENDREENFRSLRDARLKAERERDEMMRLLQATMQRQEPQKQEIAEPEEQWSEFEDIDPDSLVDGKHLKQIAKQMKAMRNEMQKYKSQSSEAMVESRIKASYPDFDKVVSQENVALLNEMYPELARTLRDTSDLYSKAVSAYNVIKKFGIHQDANPVQIREQKQVQKNLTKPRPLASVNPQQGDSPLSKANAFANGELSQEMKEQLRREMYNARRNH